MPTRALAAQLAERYPRWFRGRRATLVTPLARVVARWSRLDPIASFLARHDDLRDFSFVRAALEFLQADYAIHDEREALRRIPATGGVLVVANHPSGALDALAILDAIGRVRRDVAFVANDLLSTITPIAGLLLPVRILGGRPDPASLRAIEDALGAGRCVVIFPAGEVSRLGWRGVRDGRWRRGVLRFAEAGGVAVLPLHVSARNSAVFYGASVLFKPAGTMLLAREMFARRRKRISLSIGQAEHLPAELDAGARLRLLRQRVHALGAQSRHAERTGAATSGPEALAAAEDAPALRAAVQAVPLAGRTHDGKEIRIGRLAADSPLLAELGRERERTFRAVGEGTGRARDLDVFDHWYEHVVLWDAAAGRIAGGYRLANGARVLAERCLAGFYTASLFDYTPAALPRIAQGLELGRSFVAPEYWSSRSLDYLWQGIGAYLRAHPDLRYLFGPVSISAALPEAAREQIVAYYAHYHAGEGTARSRNPFLYRSAPEHFGTLDAGTALKVLRANLDALGSSIPVLYKQYVDLCEPGGARFLAFGVDPDFSDAIDGLIEVDLACLKPQKRQRYLERAA